MFVLRQAASRGAEEKAAYTGSWAPSTATAQAQHSFLELTGPEPASRLLLAVRYSPAPPGLNQSECLNGRGFQQRAERGLGLAPLKTATWLKEAGLFSELRLGHTAQDWCWAGPGSVTGSGSGERMQVWGSGLEKLGLLWDSSPASSALPVLSRALCPCRVAVGFVE